MILLSQPGAPPYFSLRVSRSARELWYFSGRYFLVYLENNFTMLPGCCPPSNLSCSPSHRKYSFLHPSTAKFWASSKTPFISFPRLLLHLAHIFVCTYWFIFFFKILFIYSWETHRERGGEGKGRSKLHVGSPTRDPIPEPQDQALSWRQR